MVEDSGAAWGCPGTPGWGRAASQEGHEEPEPGRGAGQGRGLNGASLPLSRSADAGVSPEHWQRESSQHPLSFTETPRNDLLLT